MIAFFKEYFWPIFVVFLFVIGTVKLVVYIERSNAKYTERSERMVAQQELYATLDIPRDEGGSRYIIGNISGYRVQMPPKFIRGWVTYDGDPSDWDTKAKREYKRPLTSYESNIAQFHLYFRIRDGALLDEGGPIYQEYRKDMDLKRHQWASVLSNSGKFYPKFGKSQTMSGFFESYTKDSSGAPFAYAGHKFGLDIYSFYSGTKPPPDSSWDKRNVFIRLNEAREITTLIRCTNNPEFAVQLCKHFFYLPDDEVQVFLQVDYAHQFLPQWQQIETRVAEIINGFIVRDAVADAKAK